MFSGTAAVNYLSTLSFDDEFLSRIEQAAPGVEVCQVPVDAWDEIPLDVWRAVDVLHTSSAVCPPAATPRLRWIQLDTSGVDHLSLHPVWDSEVAITTIGGVSPRPMAEYVLWAILGTAHQMAAWHDVQRSRRWPAPQQRWLEMMPRTVQGATVGIVRYGRIGAEIGRLARAVGLNVIGLSRTAGARVVDSGSYYGASGRGAAGAGRDAQDGDVAGTDGVEQLGPDGPPELMRRSDYVVVVVPLTPCTPSTRAMLDAAALAELKDGAVVINVSRGGVVDEDALRTALRSGRIRAAVLDVFDEEPLEPGSTWRDEPRVFVTPHVGGLAPGYSGQVLDIVTENLRRSTAGRPLLNSVDRVHGY